MTVLDAFRAHVVACSPMLTGAPLLLAHRFDAAEAARLVDWYGATFTVAAATAYTALMNAPEARARDLSSLTKAYSGGAPVAPATAAAWEELTGALLHTVYGLTETTSPSHMAPLGVRPPVDPASGAAAVGRDVAGTTTRILPDTGEIAIRGPQVVPGYWGRPEETAAALPDGELRTGDVGVLDDDGRRPTRRRARSSCSRSCRTASGKILRRELRGR
ncbi:MAG TPA: AMP-binding protein [Baekduia sp.]|uniref:AMP-binding protein n=1 Tax=Baekduia sp. TaxID=2600305 RepID=UPI002D7A0889|nr:AMP-binding protein [Baekduia sp.]HET6507937.1 AMP-binding protein [Baekduia sp.]